MVHSRASVRDAPQHRSSAHPSFKASGCLALKKDARWQSKDGTFRDGAAREPTWIAFDLQAARAVRKLRLINAWTARGDDDSFKALVVETSADGLDGPWAPRQRYREVPRSREARAIDALLAPSVEARYWRLRFLENHGGFRCACSAHICTIASAARRVDAAICGHS